MPERTASAATKADTLLLVGCGQMGSAMLRGWMVRDAAAGFIAIEPAGLPSSFADATSIAWHAAAEELPDDLTPDAVVFAVKPQIINDVLPAYRRWVRPQSSAQCQTRRPPSAGASRSPARTRWSRRNNAACVRRCLPRSARALGSRTRRFSIP